MNTGGEWQYKTAEDLRRIKPTFEKGYLRAIWSGIEPQLDANWHKYINALEKEQTYSKPLANNEQTMSKAGGNENDNVNVNENANANDNAQTLASIAGLNVLSEFELGLALLRKGYIVRATELHKVYERAQVKEKVQAAGGVYEFVHNFAEYIELYNRLTGKPPNFAK